MLSNIFKAYDVRGVYGKDLTEEVAYKIGRAFAYFLKCKDVVVGYDMRVSSPALSKAFMEGANDEGTDAIDIGMVSTDALYFASGLFKIPGVMFTASHNPKEYNGIKFCKADAVPINENTGLQQIKAIIEKEEYLKSGGKNKGIRLEKNVLSEYAKHALSFIDKNRIRSLKIAADAGNGMAGKMIPLIYKTLPVEIMQLYFELNGTFPNHPADPSKHENLKKLQEAVRKEKCDFGMAFDGDADRVFFVDEKGAVVNASFISALIIKNILKKNPNEKIIYNLVCSKIVPETIEKYNGKAVMERVGHSFIKDTMKKVNAIFACEHSAHYYFRKNFNADSGLIASFIVTEIVSRENKPLSELLKEFKVYSKIEETNFEVKDKEAKLREIEKYYSKLKPKKIMKIDGISVYFDDYWLNVRPSNTEPLLRLNLEAVSKGIMKEKTMELVGLMK